MPSSTPHQAGVVVLVGQVNVGPMLHQVLDDVEPAVEAGRPQRGGQGRRRVVNVRPGRYQGLHHREMTRT